MYSIYIGGSVVLEIGIFVWWTIFEGFGVTFVQITRGLIFLKNPPTNSLSKGIVGRKTILQFLGDDVSSVDGTVLVDGVERVSFVVEGVISSDEVISS